MASLILILAELLRPERSSSFLDVNNGFSSYSDVKESTSARRMSAVASASQREDGEMITEADPVDLKISVESVWP